MRTDLLSLEPITVSAGEIAKRGSLVDLGGVRNPRTDRKHGCVSANGSKFRVKVGGKTRTVCVQARPALQVFPFDEWSQERRKSLERVFGTRLRLRKFGGSANRKLTPLTGCLESHRILGGNDDTYLRRWLIHGSSPCVCTYGRHQRQDVTAGKRRSPCTKTRRSRIDPADNFCRYRKSMCTNTRSY